LHDIDSKTLETALDGCVRYNEKEKDKYTLSFDYKILKPALERDGESGGWRQERFPEMFALYFISQSNKFDHLLKHPVLLIFLHMKWNRISMIFYFHMIFYFIFVFLLTVDIVFEDKMCGDPEVNGVRAFLIILSVVLVLRELMQFYMSPEKCGFFFNFENWLEVGIKITTVLILVGNCSKILAAVTLLLAWTEVILQFGCIHCNSLF
jgi:hypothetical protein